ncbi:MAG: exopolysaccharide biosynthesis protein [Methylobacteriaceae bacterium]|nr:exopolysaccharide biosynthesis protein [Methylobacteriaceae bacterium]
MYSEARISGVLSSLARSSGDRLSVADIVGILRGRAFALLVVLLGLPNCLPMPPPIPLVCGLLLALVAAQIAAGWATPWLPRALLRRSIPKDAVDRAVARALPVLQRLERMSRPRMTFLGSDVALRMIGFLLILFAIGLLVAAPVIGQIPLGIAVCLVGLGLVERDGILICAGFLVGAAGLALSFGFVWAILSGIERLV